MAEEQTPAAEAPVETPPAAPPVAPPAPPVVAKPSNGQPKGKMITIPEAAFGARLKREARALLAKNLGLSGTEAAKFVDDSEHAQKYIASLKAASVPPAPVAPAAPSTPAEPVEKGSVAKYKAELEQLRANTVPKNQHQKLERKYKDSKTEAELRLKAVKAGILDEDYALHLFVKSVNAGTAIEDPSQFFVDLKQTNPGLFQATPTAPKAAAPTPVPASTAPPESPAPGGETPKPSPTTPGGNQPDVGKMSEQEFQTYKRSKYGSASY